MDKFGFYFSSISGDPHDAMAAITHAMDALDFQANLNGVDGMLDKKQLPLYINGVIPEGDYKTHYKLGIYKSQNFKANLNSDITPKKVFLLGDTVRHIDTGLELFIRASVWNSGVAEYFYVTAHFDDYKHPGVDLLPKIEQYPQNTLMSADEFDLLNEQLNKVTENTWFMNQYIQRFECMENKARKMSMADARHVVNRFNNGEVIPF